MLEFDKLDKVFCAQFVSILQFYTSTENTFV